MKMRVEMKFVVALLFLNTAVTAVASIDNAIIVVVPKPIERHVASQSVQLTCIAYGIPFPNVMWTRLPATNLVASEVPVPLANITNNMTFTVSNGGFVASTIDLCNVQLSNAGRYRCSASNSLSGSNSSYEFSLSITPQDNAIIVVMPKPIERHLTSQSIQLTCTAYGIPFPSVTWTRLPATNLVASEVRLPLTNITTNMTTANNVSSGGFVTSTINLCNVQLSNAGRYRCSASNSASDSNSSYAFSLSITPQESIKIVLHPQSIENVLVNETVKLVCAASGAPPPDSIVWSNSTAQIVNDSSCTSICIRQYTQVNNNSRTLLISVLELCSVKTTDRGEYHCTAGNETVSFTVQVQVPAAIIQSGGLVEREEGESVSFNCNANGLPVPNITWWRNEELLNPLPSRYSRNDMISDGFRLVPHVMQRKSVLSIFVLVQSDGGNYTCRAQSANTTETELSYQLTISLSPLPTSSPVFSPSPTPAVDHCASNPCNNDGICENQQDSFSCRCTSQFTGRTCNTRVPSPIAPRIVESPQDTSGTLSSNVTLTCVAVGNPKPEIIWYRNGNRIPSSDPEHLMIRLTLENRGFYYCMAQNSEGETRTNNVLVSIEGIIQYKVTLQLPDDYFARRKRQTNSEQDRINRLIDLISTMLDKAVFDDALFVSVRQLPDESGSSNMSPRNISLILTLNTTEGAPEDHTKLRMEVEDNLNNVAKQLNVAIMIVGEPDRFDGCPAATTTIDSHSGREDLAIDIRWPETDLGMTANRECPCGTLQLSSTQLRATRYCGGSFVAGAQWEAPSIAACNTSDITRLICSLSNSSSEEKLDGLQNITERTGDLGNSEVVASVTLLVSTTEDVAGDADLSDSFFEVVDNILIVSTTVLQQNQRTANTSSRLLASLETVTNSLPIEDSSEPVLITQRNFALSVQEVDPDIFMDLSFSASFGDDFNFTVGSTINSSDLTFDSAAQQQPTGSITLPSNLLSHLNQTSNGTRISFMVFPTDSLFLRRQNNSRTVGSIILAADVVGERLENLTPPVNITLQRNLDIGGTDPECRFWDQTLDSGYGDWSSEGCMRLGNYSDNDTIITCQCNHLTSFAILMDVSPTPPIMNGKTPVDIVQSAITYIGISVSIICLLITIATYLLAKQLRIKDQGQLLLLLCFALLGLYIAFIVAEFVTKVMPLCVLFSGLIQYFMLVTFMAMLAEAINLYMKLVVVLGNQISNYVVKAYIVCWVVPLFIVLLTLPPGYYYYKHDFFCRPFYVPFYVGTAGPVAVIYIFNWVLYIIILVSLIMRSRESINKEAKKQIRQQLIVAMSLAVLFGLGWGIGFVATEELPEPLRLLMSIVFNCLATFQGLFIFLFQCVYPKSVRQVWKEYINTITPKRSKGISTFGTSSEARFGSLTKSENLLSKQPISSTLPGNEMKPLTDGELKKAPAELKCDHAL